MHNQLGINDLFGLFSSGKHFRVYRARELYNSSNREFVIENLLENFNVPLRAVSSRKLTYRESMCIFLNQPLYGFYKINSVLKKYAVIENNSHKLLALKPNFVVLCFILCASSV